MAWLVWLVKVTYIQSAVPMSTVNGALEKTPRWQPTHSIAIRSNPMRYIKRIVARPVLVYFS